MTILAIIENIKADSGKKHKESVIHNSDNETFRRVLSMTYDPRIKFGIKSFDFEGVSGGGSGLSLEDGLTQLDRLSSREITGSAAKQHLYDVLTALGERDRAVATLIIGQSLGIGCGASTINKALGKNFIKDTPYMGCSSFSESKASNLFASKDLVFSQIKIDGRYSNKRIIDGVVTCESRQGLDTDFGETFDGLTIFQDLYGEPIVLNGELNIKGVSRYESNGIISSLASIGDKIQEGLDVTAEKHGMVEKHGDSYENFLSKLSYVVWDFIPNSVYVSESKWSGMSYAKRFERLSEMVADSGLENVHLVESRVVKTPVEAKEHYLEAIAKGEEGTVIKADREWSDSKPAYNLKVKLEMAVDMTVTSFNYGTGKNKGLISSLNVETSCGLIKTSPAGMKEDMMRYVTDNQDRLIGKIVEMKSNGISQDSSKNYSMLHPAFIRFRDDKEIANSLDECREIEQMAKEIEGFEMVTSESLRVTGDGLSR